MTLVEFLLARIAEDEALADDALGETWGVGSLSGVRGSHVFTQDKTVPYTGGQVADIAHQHEPTADYVARWHPARVLAECEAKRRIVEWAQDYGSPAFDMLCILGAPYTDHPDYDPTWRL